MKKYFYILLSIAFLAACGEKKAEKSVVEAVEEVESNDSTLYGVCVNKTDTWFKMVNSVGDTLKVFVNTDDTEDYALVNGGIIYGDRMAVNAVKTDDGFVASKVINITSLLGRWKSIDKDFELTDDGDVVSYLADESNQWNSWKILNGQLLLNRDTFDIVSLNGDSLELENRVGIFVYTRNLKE